MNPKVIKLTQVSKYFKILKYNETMFHTLKHVLSNTNMRKRFWALKNINITVHEGDNVAIIGANGSGKSTLLRIIAGIYTPTNGNVYVSEPPAAMFSVATALISDLQVIDNIFLYGAIYNINRNYLTKHMESIVEDLGLSRNMYNTVNNLSSGQQQRLALGVFFHTPKNIMIFDESLTFLDKSFENKCHENLTSISRSNKKTLLLVSHDMELLSRYCQKAIWFDKGRIRMTGGIDEVIQKYNYSYSEEDKITIM